MRVVMWSKGKVRDRDAYYVRTLARMMECCLSVIIHQLHCLLLDRAALVCCLSDAFCDLSGHTCCMDTVDMDICTEITPSFCALLI